MKDKILKFKKIHTVISIVIFTLLISYCIFSLPNLHLSAISLSRFGISEGTSSIWNIGLFGIGLMLYASVWKNIYSYFEDEIINKRLTILFIVSSIMLLLTAVIDMKHSIHNITAILYFIGYTLGMFLFGYKLLITDFRMGMTSIVASICSIIFPLIGLFIFPGLAIPEIVHTGFIFLWDITLTFDIEYKNLLKKIGL